MLDSLARFCYRRRRYVLAFWVVLLVGLGALGSNFAGEYKSDFELPRSESQRVFDLLREEFGNVGDDSLRVVLAAENLNEPPTRQRVEKLLSSMRTVEGVTGVASPYVPGPAQIAPQGKVGFAAIQLKDFGTDVPTTLIDALKTKVEAASTGGLRAILGGQGVRFAEQEQGFGPSESIGLIAAAIILLVTFGSVIAMGLPLVTAIFGLGIGISLGGLIANVIDMPEFAPALASMIGLGVGIDYALFIVTRYRQTLHAGVSPEDSIAVAVDTSGRAVLFAGITVVISLLGLFIVGLKFIQGLAVGASLAVLVTMLASLTLLPAIIGFAGHAIDRLHVPGLHRDESDHRSSFWFRWSRIVQRRPIPAFIAGVLVLLVLAIPLFSIELGFTDEGNDPPESSARQAYDLLAEGFGPGFNGPLLLVAEVDSPQDLQEFKNALARTKLEEGVAAVSPPIPNADRSVVLATVYPAYAPQDHATHDLIGRLRASLPSDPDVAVGGITALFVDFSDYLAERLFYFIGAVLVLSFLLLMLVFRSLLIPLKAAIVNLLGIAASYGVVVAVFQWGWLSDLVGISRTGPVEPFLPLMLFAIVFGLSMDYEVFLMSRIREEYVRTKRNDIAVADGLAATARVITAAAAIMITLFLSFVLGDERTIKLFGLGLAVAIFLDATIIRMIVVPSLMEMFGDANWWIPRWLDRILPRVSVEAPAEHLLVAAVVPEVLEPAAKPTVRKAAAKPKGKPRTKAKPGSAAKAKAKPKPKPRAKAKPKPKPAKRKPAARKPR